MATLPTPGADIGSWGDELNTFLLVAHNTDGTQKPEIAGVPVSLAGIVAGNVLSYDGDTFVPVDPDAAPAAAVDFAGQKGINLGTPTADTDAATKLYVDNVATGLDFKDAVRAASTANLTLSGTQTVDGVALVAGDRVLVKNQTTGSQNGIYVVASGAWSRSADADTSGEVTSGMFTLVTEGTLNGSKGFVLNTAGAITLGTTSLNFTPFSQSSTADTSILNVATKTTTYTVTTTDHLLLVSAPSAAWTLTFYTAIGNAGRQIRVKKTDATANIVSCDPFGSQTIDGQPTYGLQGQWTSATFVSDGANWFVIAEVV